MARWLIYKHSIQIKLFVSYFLLIFILLGVIAVSVYQISAKIIENEVGHSRLEVLHHIGQNMDGIFKEIVSVSNIYQFNEELMDIIYKPSPKDQFERNKDASRVAEIVSSYIYVFDKLKYYSVLYSFNGRKYSSWINDLYDFERLPKRQWYQEVINNNGKILWVSTYNDKDAYKEDQFVFSAARLLKRNFNNQPLGVLSLNVNESVLFEAYRYSQSIGSEIYIVDKNGNIVSHENKDRLGLNVFEQPYIKKAVSSNEGALIAQKAEEKMLISYLKLPTTEWTLVEEVPLAILLKPMQKMKTLTFLLLVFGLGVSLVLSYVIASRISRPIKSLKRDMKRVETGNLNVYSEINSEDEIGELSRGFNRMISRLQNLMDDVVTQEALKRKAEFEFLQAQIKPHFLYNTLTSIRSMVATDHLKEAEQMLLTLSRLLRKLLNRHDEFITVKEELDILQEYVQLQNYRYADKFEVVYDVPQELMDYDIPRLILQPIVENSIFHGIEPMEGRGTIVICGYEQQGELVFLVTDDGVGMDTVQLNEIWRKRDRSGTKSSNSVGLMNIHERLLLNFGIEYGLEIHSYPSEGTSVKIRMPLIKGRGENTA